MKARPLQKKENAVQTRATVFQNLSFGNIFKRRTCLVASSWMCVDMVPFHFVCIYLFNVKGNLWPHCFCFHHTRFKSSGMLPHVVD